MKPVSVPWAMWVRITSALRLAPDASLSTVANACESKAQRKTERARIVARLRKMALDAQDRSHKRRWLEAAADLIEQETSEQEKGGGK